MKKYLPSWFVIAFASGILITGITVVIPGAVADDIVAQSAAVELFMDVFSRTVTSYVDSLESRELVEAALRGMLESLDPNSILMNPEDYENFHISMEGSFQGVGITIGIRDEWLTVIAPLEGTPAFRAGMKAGDRIVMIDSMSTEGININEAVSHIRGPRGSFVLLTVERPGINDSLLFNIERDNIELPCISASIMLDSLTGYMRLSQFTNSSALDVELALKELEKDGAENFIIDLRGNPGGLLIAAVDIIDLFIPAGEIAVRTFGNAVGTNSFNTNRDVIFGQTVILLINSGSASSSEIVAGALQDHNAAVLIGTRTFGKGSVQTIMDLGEYPGLGHYGVKITTARYFTPSGRCIDRTLAEDFDITESESDSTSDWGIEPDITIENTDLQGTILVDLLFEAMYFKFATEYSLENDISEDWWPDALVIAEFRDYLDLQEFEWDPDEFEDNLEYIERAIFAELATREFGRDTYVRVMIPHDEVIQRALECLENGQ